MTEISIREKEKWICRGYNKSEDICNVQDNDAEIINQRTNGPVNAQLRPEIYTCTCTNKLVRLEWYNACI